MERSSEDVFARLEAALSEWSGAVGASRRGLESRIAEARARVDSLAQSDPAPDRIADLERALDSVASLGQLTVESLASLAEGVQALRSDISGLREAVQRLSIKPAEPMPSPAFPNPAEDESARQLAQAIRDRDEAQEEIRRLRAELDRLDAQTFPRPAGFIPDLRAVDSAGHKRRMGEVLVEHGFLTPQQVEAALSDQAGNPHARLGDILVEKGYTTDEVVAQVLAAQSRLPYVDLRSETPEPEAVAALDARLAFKHSCLPLRLFGDRLTVAMVNPLDLIAIDDIELATGRHVEPVVASRAALLEGLEQNYE